MVAKSATATADGTLEPVPPGVVEVMFGPNIASNSLLGDRKGLTKLLRNGGIKMPAVGKDWPQEQLDATIAYLQQRFKQGSSGGGQG